MNAEPMLGSIASRRRRLYAQFIWYTPLEKNHSPSSMFPICSACSSWREVDGTLETSDSRLATYLLIGFGADDVGFARKAPDWIELRILEFDQLPLALCALGRWVEVGEALEPSHLRRLGVRKKVGAKLSETKNSPRCSARHQRQTNPRMR